MFIKLHLQQIGQGIVLFAKKLVSFLLVFQIVRQFIFFYIIGQDETPTRELFFSLSFKKLNIQGVGLFFSLIIIL